MKLAIKIALIAFFSFWAEQIFPWWSALVCAAVISALIPTTSLRAFMSGFTAVGLLWLVCALIFSAQTDFVLSSRVASLFGVNSSAFIIFLTTLIGGIAGGMGALCGNQLRKTVQYKAAYRSRHAEY
ncbi:hypothetical protein [Cesiribacter sp. SM1]|uniref:hypothetical protein n=1 Tax=Cesiribacter sp. SM1 TaxID=2861196 RepID=UPI001CD2AB56|nr:hypothetical protein [Cesiribacter sp. SM1]